MRRRRQVRDLRQWTAKPGLFRVPRPCVNPKNMIQRHAATPKQSIKFSKWVASLGISEIQEAEERSKKKLNRRSIILCLIVRWTYRQLISCTAKSVLSHKLVAKSQESEDDECEEATIYFYDTFWTACDHRSCDSVCEGCPRYVYIYNIYTYMYRHVYICAYPCTFSVGHAMLTSTLFLGCFFIIIIYNNE